MTKAGLRAREWLRTVRSDRLMGVWLLLMLATGGLFARLFYLQVHQSETLRQRAQTQQISYIQPFVPRPTIVDRHQQVLAVDRPAYVLFVHGHLLRQPKSAIASALAPFLTKDTATLAQAIPDRGSVKLVDGLTEETARGIRALGLDGVELMMERRRYYPQQDLAAEVVGYVNLIDHRGRAGVEMAYDRWLTTNLERYQVRRDGLGRIIPQSVKRQVLFNERTFLQLTIDQRTQRVARQLLKAAIAKYNAKRGTVLVMDAQTGEMRALVTEPTFDPNRYFDYAQRPEVFKNWAVTDLYEPGSTFKPINIAIALEGGYIQPDSTFYDEGMLTIDGWPVANFDFESKGPVGVLTISQILERSSNVGMVHIMEQMPPAVYYSWLQRLGLGQPSGIDLPSEPAGELKSQAQFTTYRIEAATTAFGQGFSLTPIQMLQLHGILASGGKILTPHVVKGLFNEEGELLYRYPLPEPRQVLSPTTTVQVLKMMEAVVEKGTGQAARIPGYRLGGKTGTAQKADERGGYANAKITSFVGIFPTTAPRYVVMAVIDEPLGDDAFGSTVAAPIVKGVIADLIAADKIPPSHPEELLQKASPQTPNQNTRAD
ncbi:MAG: penicillin-binding protein 2 [Pseudanabaenaceae cyanobacterium SKYGB_i_bin29]|nr:penicillin-binding protein 2 [Pseudanabaenaceae cyanobacterium SKYG29]MDW8420558.1 penicillin-binding protein 2 [Pseudanabaenaceae cyanobacterium SKYGB_i_bin29]